MRFASFLSISSWTLFVLTSISCDRPPRATTRDSLLLNTDGLKFYYNLHEPKDKYPLPYSLAEISGLSFLPPNSLLTIQDERGILYEFNLTSKKIAQSIKFDSKNDFEGIELVGDSIFILESDGDIRMFLLSDSSNASKNMVHIDTELTAKNDSEGLGYDPSRNCLLIACKASGEVNQNGVKGKAVYRFSLETMKLEPTPIFTVTKKSLEIYFEKGKKRDYEAERFRFEPSAVAFNPVDKLFYVLASVGKMIIVFDTKGNIQATYSVPSSLLIQPEGLCFSPSGDMFISSEGDGEKGYVIQYSMKRQ